MTEDPKSVAEAVVLGKGGIRYYRPDKLVAWPGLNPRTHFDEERIRELAASIAEHGILQPLLVSAQEGEDVDWVVAGESRLRAACLAEQGCPEIGLEPVDEIWIPAMVRELAEGEALAIAVLENVQRQNLTAIEEARGFARLLELNHWTQAKLAEEILGDAGRQSVVSTRLRLLDLPEDIVALIESGDIHASHARDYLVPLLKLEDEQPSIALGRVLNVIHNQLADGGEIRGEWLQDLVGRIKREVVAKYGPRQLFEPAAPAAEEPTAPLPADQEDTTAPTDSEEAQLHALLLILLRRSEATKAECATLQEEGATDVTIQYALNRICGTGTPIDGDIAGVGTYTAVGGATARVTLTPLTTKRATHLTGQPLVNRVRQVLNIGPEKMAEPEAASAAPEVAPSVAPDPPADPPKPAPKAAPKPAPVPAPAAPPPPPAAPVATLEAPGTARGEMPEGAGIITALLTAMSRRPCVLSMTPLPTGQIAVMVSPKINKAGEKPFAMTGTAAELDAELVAALDSHFSQ